ncbi:MAG: hypothetical protein GX827_00475 [Clostridiales bacterium]|nr:hypothetical protein [Clostridiales bacterium]
MNQIIGIIGIIEDNHNLTVFDIRLLDSHFGTEIYKIDTDKGEYIVKAMPSGMELSECEGLVTEYLAGKEIKTARLRRSRQGGFIVKASDRQITVQEFIKGRTYEVSTAPDWLMTKSAETLGKINAVLSEYDVKAMPYLLYFWHCICNYVPGELPNIPESYKPTAILIQKLLAWLYDNVDRLSNDLSSRKLNRHN